MSGSWGLLLVGDEIVVVVTVKVVGTLGDGVRERDESSS